MAKEIQDALSEAMDQGQRPDSITEQFKELVGHGQYPQRKIIPQLEPIWFLFIGEKNVHVKCDCQVCHQTSYLPNPDDQFIHCGRRDSIPEEIKKKFEQVLEARRPKSRVRATVVDPIINRLITGAF